MQSRNYRPVSLTSVCKLLESLLRDHMVDFLEKHNLLKDTHYTARVSKRTVVFDKLVRIYGNNIKMGR